MKSTVPIARRLRKNPSDAERTLWSALRKHQQLGYKFRRQAPIGRYIVDFLCVKAGLVIEVDGGQHGNQSSQDLERTRYLESNGTG